MSDFISRSVDVAYGSSICIAHQLTPHGYLHSHPQKYPTQYPDGRISSGGQQVTLYTFKDGNNWWRVHRVTDADDQASERNGDTGALVRNGDVLRLEHVASKAMLRSHDVASPLQPTHQEVTLHVSDGKLFTDDLWRVEMDDPQLNYWEIVSKPFRLVHNNSGTVLFASGQQLPEWGFRQYQVNANKYRDDTNALWLVESHENPNRQCRVQRTVLLCEG